MHLEETEVILYEGAIRHRNLFAGAEIFQKSRNIVDIMGVKAKSFNSEGDGDFRKKNGEIRPEMLPYLQEVVFLLPRLCRYLLGGQATGAMVRSFHPSLCHSVLQLIQVNIT